MSGVLEGVAEKSTICEEGAKRRDVNDTSSARLETPRRTSFGEARKEEGTTWLLRGYSYLASAVRDRSIKLLPCAIGLRFH